MGKIVQVELNEREYRQLSKVAEKKGLTIEEAFKEAIIFCIKNNKENG
jgi:hypothetical protein